MSIVIFATEKDKLDLSKDNDIDFWGANYDEPIGILKMVAQADISMLHPVEEIKEKKSKKAKFRIKNSDTNS